MSAIHVARRQIKDTLDASKVQATKVDERQKVVLFMYLSCTFILMFYLEVRPHSFMPSFRFIGDSWRSQIPWWVMDFLLPEVVVS